MKHTCIALLCLAILAVTQPPQIEVKRMSSDPYFADPWDSLYRYNYNSAFLPQHSRGFTLAVRVQNLKTDAKNIYDVGPSAIALSYSNTTPFDNPQFSYISHSSVIVSPDDNPVQALGAEDPRIVLYGDTYYLFYSAVSQVEHSTDARSQLALATCAKSSDPMVPANWKQRGPLFTNRFWSKSGALLVHNATNQYLFFGDTSIFIATSNDMLNYRDLNQTLLATRSNMFDSELVESGPEPIRLSNGNYLFLYNSARKTDIKNPKPNWNLEYNLGWAILDGKDPTKVLYRAEKPILSPELGWEKCDSASEVKWQRTGLTPLVVFVEGWQQTGKDQFLVIYQGCDAFTGFFTLQFNVDVILAVSLVFLQNESRVGQHRAVRACEYQSREPTTRSLNFTKDPYQNNFANSWWFNLGYQQIHVPMGQPSQIIDGSLGIVVPNLEAIEKSLTTAESKLVNTKFSWKKTTHQDADVIEVTDPVGSPVRIHQYNPLTYNIRGGLGMAYIQVNCPRGTLQHIERFYIKYFSTPTSVSNEQLKVTVGPHQHFIFEEKDHCTFDNDYHVCIYVNNFDSLYKTFDQAGLLHHEHTHVDSARTLEDAHKHSQFRVKNIITEQGETVLKLEHEVRSLFHGSFMRPLVNRTGNSGIYCNQ